MKGIKNTQATIQNINIKIDPVVKEAADGVLSGMGLNMSAYIGMCLRQVAQDRKLPFAQTVNPDFWAAEASVSAAKSYIDSGAFESAAEFTAKLKRNLEEATERATLEAWKRAPEEKRTEIAALLSGPVADHLDSLDISNAGKILSQTTKLPEFARKSAEMVDSDCRSYFDAFAEALESAVPAITDAVDSAFESDARLRDVLSCDPSDLTVEEKADALDEITTTVITAANDHPSNLSLRFMGTGNRSALNDALSFVDSFNRYRDWLSKADDRKQRRGEERDRQFHDLIRAVNGTPSVQNLTQVMPKPERNLSSEEMIEQAETFKKIMGILNDEGDD